MLADARHLSVTCISSANVCLTFRVPSHCMTADRMTAALRQDGLTCGVSRLQVLLYVVLCAFASALHGACCSDPSSAHQMDACAVLLLQLPMRHGTFHA